jgi:hypothetical protein
LEHILFGELRLLIPSLEPNETNASNRQCRRVLRPASTLAIDQRWTSLDVGTAQQRGQLVVKLEAIESNRQTSALALM